MSSKLQVAVVIGVIVGGAVLLQNSVPCLANSAGMLYLRAEYKLVKGDTAGAMRLMQQASVASPSQPSAQPVQKTSSETAQSCSRRTSAKQIATARTSSPSSVAVTVNIPHVNAGRTERLVVKVPDKWSVQHARLMEQIQARAAQRNAEVAETMHRLEAKLRNVPLPPAPPVAALPFATE